MSERVNCEVFQVVAGAYRLTANRGLAVTKHKGHKFLDPQIEPRFNTSLGPAEPENLKIELSRHDPPEIKKGLITDFSIARDALINFKEIRRYRAFRKTEKAVGQVALVSVVNHDGVTALVQLGRNSVNGSFLQFYRYEYSWRKKNDGAVLDDPFIQLMQVAPGGGISIPHYVGNEFNGSMGYFYFTYDADSEEGLSLSRNQFRIEPPKSGGDNAADREPRNPLMPNLSGQAAFEDS
jgi:hypothetical protein